MTLIADELSSHAVGSGHFGGRRAAHVSERRRGLGLEVELARVSKGGVVAASEAVESRNLRLHLDLFAIVDGAPAVGDPVRREGGYAGGGGLLPGKRPRNVYQDGTWGVDYVGFPLPRHVWLHWRHDENYQGGMGAYKTDGPHVKKAVWERLRK